MPTFANISQLKIFQIAYQCMIEEISKEFILNCLTADKIKSIEQTFAMLKEFQMLCRIGEMSLRQKHIILAYKFNMCRKNVIERLKPHLKKYA